MYPGGKGNSYQRIINWMPPHDVYVEPYLGRGYVMAAKEPARLNIGVEINPLVLAETAAAISPEAFIVIPDDSDVTIAKNGDGSGAIATNDGSGHSWKFLCMDALAFLRGYEWHGNELVYCDPPYLMQTRRNQRPLYEYEFSTETEHERLLSLLISLPCRVIISGYWSELYMDMLASWNTDSFDAVTRGGTMATEWLWMNYQEPAELHDYQYLGSDFRERERIKRKAARWVKRFRQLPRLERMAIVSELRGEQLLQPRQKERCAPARTAETGDAAVTSVVAMKASEGATPC